MDKPLLIVDDNPIDVDLTQRALLRNGLENPIQIARDGQAALDFIGRWEAGETCPAVILMDVNLPNVSGIEVFRNLQAHPIFRLIPVFFLLSCEDDQLFLTKSLGSAQPFFVKPVSGKEFIRATKPFGLSWSFATSP